uniref:Uncharacterized protein n=1 Tax=Anopheles atroparvus TaxID=41427 RepID=A0A182JHV3_ANOAO
MNCNDSLRKRRESWRRVVWSHCNPDRSRLSMMNFRCNRRRNKISPGARERSDAGGQEAKWHNPSVKLSVCDNEEEYIGPKRNTFLSKAKEKVKTPREVRPARIWLTTSTVLLGPLEAEHGALREQVPTGREAGLQVDGTEQRVVVGARRRLLVQFDADVDDADARRDELRRKVVVPARGKRKDGRVRKCANMYARAGLRSPYVPPIDGIGERQLGVCAELQQLERLLRAERYGAHLVPPVPDVAVRAGAHNAQALEPARAVRLQYERQVGGGRVAAPEGVAHDQVAAAREVAREQPLVVLDVAQLEARAAVERVIEVVRPVRQRIGAPRVLERGRVRDGRLEVLARQVEPALVGLRATEAIVKLARAKTERAVKRELVGAAHVQVAPEQVPEAVVRLQELHVAVVRLEALLLRGRLQRLVRPAGREQRDRELEGHHLLERDVGIHLRLLAAAEHVDADKHVLPALGAIVADVVLGALEMLPGPAVVQEDAVACQEERVVRTVQLVLPRQPAVLGDRVVPDHKTARDLSVAPLGQQAHEVAQQADLGRLQAALDVQQPAVELRNLRHTHQRVHHAHHELLRLQDVAQQLHAGVLDDERADHLDAVLVRTVQPLERRDRDKVVAEVAEDVDRRPVVEPVVHPLVFTLHAVDELVVQIVALEVVAQQHLRSRLILHVLDRAVLVLQHLVALTEVPRARPGRDRLDQVLPRMRRPVEVQQGLHRQHRLAHLRI